MELVFRTGNPGALLVSGLRGPRYPRLAVQLGRIDDRLRQLGPRITAGGLGSGRQEIPSICAAVMRPDFVRGA